MRRYIGVAGLALAVAAGSLLAVVPADAQRGMGRGMGRGQSMGATVPGVQNLTAQQRQQIMGIRRDLQQRIQEIRSDRNISASQRDQRIQQAHQDAHNRIVNVLTPEQRRQFQSWWQGRGEVRGYRGGMQPGMMPMGGGMVPGVEDLTDDQRSRISSIREAMRSRLQEARSNRSLSAAERQSRITEIHRDTHNQIVDVLTPVQRRQFQNWWQQRSGMGR